MENDKPNRTIALLVMSASVLDPREHEYSMAAKVWFQAAERGTKVG